MKDSTVSDVLEGRTQWCVVLGDCRDVLPTLGDKSVAHVITDPPYHARAMKNARSNGETMKQRRDGVVYDFNYSALDEETRRMAAAQFARLSRRWVLTWTDIESDHLWRGDMEAFGLEYIRLGIWHRINSAPQFSGDRPAHNVEACVIMHTSGRKHWNGGGRPAFWSHSIVNSQDPSREHTTPKPVQLMLDQVADFTDHGEVVLDPFTGSGTTGVACLRLGRRFIGVERESKYHAIAVERLKAESRSLTLRDARAGQSSIFDVLSAASVANTGARHESSGQLTAGEPADPRLATVEHADIDGDLGAARVRAAHGDAVQALPNGARAVDAGAARSDEAGPALGNRRLKRAAARHPVAEGTADVEAPVAQGGGNGSTATADRHQQEPSHPAHVTTPGASRQ